MDARDAERPVCCFVCGVDGADVDWFTLLQGRATRLLCSSSCLAEIVDRRRRVAARRRLRGAMVLLVLALGVAGVNTARRYRAPAPEWICGDPPEPIEAQPGPGPVPYGPNWPPTDAEWTALFATAHWIYPLPGPVRHPVSPDPRVFGPAAAEGHLGRCHSEGRCGVDLGGDLWGEHVYAAHDGVVDSVQGGGHDEHGGQYVRLSHFGGTVFTQYFHLAAVPRGIARGARVKAGELVGLLGDTGTETGHKHLYFALSVRPSTTFPEVYWDPSPWMGTWPLRVPPNGTVAGLKLVSREGR